MTFREWARDSVERVRERPVAGAKESAYQLYFGLWRRAGRTVNFGRSFWERDWDVLVVLDGCRYDLMQAVGSVPDAEPFVSNASASAEWMQKNFGDRYRAEMARTVHVTANPHSEDNLRADEFLCLDEVWRDAWDAEFGSVRPRPVTDRAITRYREFEPERTIIHYMQPHHPFRNAPKLDAVPANSELGGDADHSRSNWKETPWGKLRRGEVSYEYVWRHYRENLEYVLEELPILQSNFEGTLVLTADHGNAMGELGLYGHKMYAPSPATKRVPWLELQATDERTHEPGEEVGTDVSHEQRLRDLGYL